MPISLAPYRHLLLDMNGTFLFGFDRFGKEQDFAATYRRLGFTELEPQHVQHCIRASYDYLAARYVDPDYYNRFPAVADAIRRCSAVPLNAQQQRELLLTFSAHEMGHLPEAHRLALMRLAELRPVSILSNLWAPKAPWIAKFRAWRIHSLFQTLYFSSDGPTIKPSPAIFEHSCHLIGLPPEQILYVGDSYRCDVLGATSAGMPVVWLNRHNQPIPPDTPVRAVCTDLVEFAKNAE